VPICLRGPIKTVFKSPARNKERLDDAGRQGLPYGGVGRLANLFVVKGMK